MRNGHFGRGLVAVMCVLALVVAGFAIPRGAYAASGTDPRTITEDGGQISRHALDGQEAYCCNSYKRSPEKGTVLRYWHSGPLALDYTLYHSDGGPEADYPWWVAKWVVWAIIEGDLRELDYYADGETLNPNRAKNHELYNKAIAWANAGGVGPERGCSRIYDPPSDVNQPICVCAIETGSVKVSKVREGGHDDTFTFRIAVKKDNVTVVDEVFTLKGGASRTFDGLPVNGTYEITETDGAQHYETEWTNRTGKIAAKTTAEVTCKNISHGWLAMTKDLAE